MAQDQRKDWRKLCEAAAKEEDSDKLLALVAQINLALDEERHWCPPGRDGDRAAVGECPSS